MKGKKGRNEERREKSEGERESEGREERGKGSFFNRKMGRRGDRKGKKKKERTVPGGEGKVWLIKI